MATPSDLSDWTKVVPVTVALTGSTQKAQFMVYQDELRVHIPIMGTTAATLRRLAAHLAQGSDAVARALAVPPGQQPTAYGPRTFTKPGQRPWR